MTAMPKRRELTARELEVLDLHAAGYVRADIAARLDISSWTVASHLRRITAIIGANGPVNLVHKAWRSPARPPEVHVPAPECWTEQPTTGTANTHMGNLINAATRQAITDRARQTASNRTTIGAA